MKKCFLLCFILFSQYVVCSNYHGRFTNLSESLPFTHSVVEQSNSAVEVIAKPLERKVEQTQRYADPMAGIPKKIGIEPMRVVGENNEYAIIHNSDTFRIFATMPSLQLGIDYGKCVDKDVPQGSCIVARIHTVSDKKWVGFKTLAAALEHKKNNTYMVFFNASRLPVFDNIPRAV